MKRTLMACLVLTGLLIGCDNKLTRGIFPYTPSNKQQSVNEIKRRSLYKIKKEYGLRPFGTGAQMMDKIEMLHLAFQYNQSISVEEARKLMIGAAQIFLAEINRHEEVRQYLAVYPFPLEKVSIEIYLRRPDGSDLAPGSLIIASLANGKLRYKIRPPENPDRLATVLKETLEEALAEIEKQERQAV